jgi:hypothetical protein
MGFALANMKGAKPKGYNLLGCPYLGGTAVYKARTLHSLSLLSDIILFKKRASN